LQCTAFITLLKIVIIVVDSVNTLLNPGAYRTLKMVFHEFPAPSVCIFRDFLGPFMSITVRVAR